MDFAAKPLLYKWETNKAITPTGYGGSKASHKFGPQKELKVWHALRYVCAEDLDKDTLTKFSSPCTSSPAEDEMVFPLVLCSCLGPVP